jgi:hypothetical protein
MSENNDDDVAAQKPDLEPIPFMQRLLDNHFVLLVIGVAFPTIFYIIWGIIEITQIPIAD